MKKILILTDFSENALCAAETGVQLSLKMHADLLLCNSYSTNAMVPAFVEAVDDDSGFSRVDDNRNKMRFLAGTLRLHIEDAMSSLAGPYPKVSTCFGEGDLGLITKQLCRDYPVELIVMGSRQGSKLYRLFYGSDTASVVTLAPVPVLIVPPKGELTSVNKILLASDFSKGDLKALSFLTGLAAALGSEIEIVHVHTAADNKSTAKVNVERFMKRLRTNSQVAVSLRQIRGRNVLASLKRACKKSDADLLGLVHRKRSFLSTLTQRSVSKEALTGQKLPLIIFPSKL